MPEEPATVTLAVLPANPQVSVEEPDPLEGLTIAQAVELVQAAVDRLSVAMAGGAVTQLPADEAVRVLAALRAATDDARALDTSLVNHIYLRAEHGKKVVDGVGEVWVSRTRSGDRWDERGALHAVVAKKMEARGGEVPDDPMEVLEWVLEVAGIGYLRKTALRTLGVPVDAYYDSVPGHPQVSLPPRT